MFGPNKYIAIMKGKFKYLGTGKTTKTHNYYHNQSQTQFQQPTQISLEQTIINAIAFLILALVIYLWFFTNF